jgi:endoglucanase
MAVEWDLLKKLCETPGIASRENQVRSVALDALRPLVQEIRIDQLGNAICVKPGKSPMKVMVAGHLDEIGFMVRHICDDVFLFLQPVGGCDP